ncbi:hypothetical protein K3G63_19350 [Hymenobacter sp. HSC-4F20]|uniref:hypothetical protein n=1 Tax=Hymenobacter sp. HSC-4F20 TaxID=2864135 RepID=UPI001C73817B|nr:hypothetical protein [Hymenobacter sp. HSC-4F20]MBX0292609.1 hypothetical protein [Hymenobacter sp. HSC-4F20]
MSYPYLLPLHGFTYLRVARSHQPGEAPRTSLTALDGIADGNMQDTPLHSPELLAAFRGLGRDLSTSVLFRATDFSLHRCRVLAPAHRAG